MQNSPAIHHWAIIHRPSGTNNSIVQDVSKNDPFCGIPSSCEFLLHERCQVAGASIRTARFRPADLRPALTCAVMYSCSGTRDSNAFYCR